MGSMTLPTSSWPPTSVDSSLAVLVSGGLDSAILLAEAVAIYPRVVPIYVEVGSAWEPVERSYLERFLEAIRTPALDRLVILEQPIGDVYGRHWSMTGDHVPDEHSADEAVFLPGRNVLLLAKPLLWCHLNGVPALATAPLVSNPFPDATPSFYDGFAAILGQAVGQRSVKVLRPYADLGLHKAEVLKRGRGMPLDKTFSCIQPTDGLHCGRCNKCAERRQGFRDAGMTDPTRYADRPRESTACSA